MDAFSQFIQRSKSGLNNLKKYAGIHLVLGNESCDLDSTISTLSLAYSHYTRYEKLHENLLVIPLLNVSSKLFPLRTETCYLLTECRIDRNSLIFKDQIDMASILNSKNLKTSIVDHHVLADSDKILQKSVVEIYDHRPINEKEMCKNPETKITINLVGSCSTLVAQDILNIEPCILNKELAHLLYATIIYDTIGLNKAHGRTTDLDISIAEKLETYLKPAQSRQSFFDLLWKIHNDTSNIKTRDLLYRDLKIVQGIPIPGLPLLVQNYLKREDALESVKSFAQEYSSSLVVLIGIDASGVEVQRDIGIFFSNDNHRRLLVDSLKQDKDGANLCLTEIESPFKNNIICLKQGNVKLTRKFILPIVNEVASKIKAQ